MKLSKETLQHLQKLKEDIIKAYKHRAEQPADFDHNIACLYRLSEVVRLARFELSPYYQKVGLWAIRYHSTPQIITDWRLSRKINNLDKLVKKTIDLMTITGAIDGIESSFLNEPRILKLNVDMDFTIDNLSGVTFFTEKPKNKNAPFKITFSDHSVLTLNSLTDKEEMERAREVFNHKMKSLAQKTEKVDEIEISHENPTPRF